MSAIPVPEPGSALADFLRRHDRIFVLTGAGCSTDSGIPAYRDASGEWARKQPVTWQAFAGSLLMQKRYWARSMVGWLHFGPAQPNAAHHALAQLEAMGRLVGLVTQNVDGLHQAAGHRNVVDLHGRLDTVVCLDCSARVLRSRHQHRLEAANPEWIDLAAARAPDGDAELESDEFDRFIVPPCRRCGGTLRPDVVFFGETVPDQRVRTALQWLDGANAMLVVGSSLMVHSGFRYARLAAERGLPVAALNLGRTRADDLLSLKIEAPCSSTLKEGTSRLAGIMQAAAPSHT